VVLNERGSSVGVIAESDAEKVIPTTTLHPCSPEPVEQTHIPAVCDFASKVVGHVRFGGKAEAAPTEDF
jgi:hypothetical protein